MWPSLTAVSSPTAMPVTAFAVRELQQQEGIHGLDLPAIITITTRHVMVSPLFYS